MTIIASRLETTVAAKETPLPITITWHLQHMTMITISTVEETAQLKMREAGGLGTVFGPT